LPEIETHKSLG